MCSDDVHDMLPLFAHFHGLASCLPVFHAVIHVGEDRVHQPHEAQLHLASLGRIDFPRLQLPGNDSPKLQGLNSPP